MTQKVIFGDQVLIDVASIIKINIRETDFAGRYGGEEFMVLFPNTSAKDALFISERIRQAVMNNHFIDGLRITISGGKPIQKILLILFILQI